MVNLRQRKIPKFDVNVPYNEEVVASFQALPNREYNGKRWSFPMELFHNVCDILEPHFPDARKSLIETCPEAYFTRKKRAELQAKTSLEGLLDVEVKEILRRVKIPNNLFLFPHQEVGVVFIELAGGRVLVGDAMGLGKTIQVLAWISTQPKEKVIWITKKLLVPQTRSEVEKWLPGKSIQTIRSGKDKIEGADITIVNYDLVGKHLDALGKLEATTVVMDEITMITNGKAKRTKAVMSLVHRIKKVIGISGTPLRGRPKNFFSFLNLLNPIIFNSEYNYWKQFCDLKEGAYGLNINGASNMKTLHQILLPMMLRRNRDVIEGLPDKSRKIVTLEAMPSFWNDYKEEEAKLKNLFLDRREEDTNKILGSLAKLRILVGQEKARQTYDVVSKYLEAGEKIVIFIHHKSVRTYLMEVFKKYNPLSIYGGQNEKEVAKNQKLFRENPKFPIIIVSTLAGGAGLNLVPAAFAFFVERQWVSDDEEQAEDRICRIVGSAPSVTISYLHIPETLDDRMEELNQEKRENTQTIMDGKYKGNDMETQKELLNRMFD